MKPWTTRKFQTVGALLLVALTPLYPRGLHAQGNDASAAAGGSASVSMEDIEAFNQILSSIKESADKQQAHATGALIFSDKLPQNQSLDASFVKQAVLAKFRELSPEGGADKVAIIATNDIPDLQQNNPELAQAILQQTPGQTGDLNHYMKDMQEQNSFVQVLTDKPLQPAAPSEEPQVRTASSIAPVAAPAPARTAAPAFSSPQAPAPAAAPAASPAVNPQPSHPAAHPQVAAAPRSGGGGQIPRSAARTAAPGAPAGTPGANGKPGAPGPGAPTGPAGANHAAFSAAGPAPSEGGGNSSSAPGASGSADGAHGKSGIHGGKSGESGGGGASGHGSGGLGESGHMNSGGSGSVVSFQGGGGAGNWGGASIGGKDLPEPDAKPRAITIAGRKTSKSAAKPGAKATVKSRRPPPRRAPTPPSTGKSNKL